jgi:hypothetical protein
MKHILTQPPLFFQKTKKKKKPEKSMQHDRTFVISILSISSPLACIFMTRSKCDERVMRARMVPLGGTKMIFQMTPKTKV